MIVSSLSFPSAVSDKIKVRIERDVTSALRAITTIGDQFIVNNSLWFKETKKDKATPCVMNAAEFISKKFQDELTIFSWRKEKKLNNQTIDAYTEIQSDEPGYSISPDKFPEFMLHYFRDNPTIELDIVFSEYYRKYVKRSIFNLEISLHKYKSFFQLDTDKMPQKVRVGLEFETGNIASAFRAFSKLNSLYYLDSIDLGVFITSHDKKNTAAQIWPASNRNGSYEELKRRDYKRNIVVPLCELSFQPDGFSIDVPFLQRDGTFYRPQSTGRKKQVINREYEVYIRGSGEEILKEA